MKNSSFVLHVCCPFAEFETTSVVSMASCPAEIDGTVIAADVAAHLTASGRWNCFGSLKFALQNIDFLTTISGARTLSSSFSMASLLGLDSQGGSRREASGDAASKSGSSSASCVIPDCKLG